MHGPNNTHPLLISMDGKNLVMRAAAWAQRQTSAGEHHLPLAMNRTLSILTETAQQLQPTAMFVAWDHGRSHHRLACYPDYKANHDEKTVAQQALSDLVHRTIPVLQSLFSTMPLYQAQVDNCEADDLIAITTRQIPVQHVIYSTDRDYLQLLSPRVYLHDPSTKHHISHHSMLSTYGLGPDQWLDYKILLGDQGDNVPGIPGIGEKTAMLLMQRFGNLSALLSNLDDAIKITSRAKILSAPETQALLERNRQLMNLRALPQEDQTAQHLPFIRPHHRPLFQEARCASILQSAGCHDLVKTMPLWKGVCYALAKHLTTLPYAPPL